MVGTILIYLALSSRSQGCRQQVLEDQRHADTASLRSPEQRLEKWCNPIQGSLLTVAIRVRVTLCDISSVACFACIAWAVNIYPGPPLARAIDMSEMDVKGEVRLASEER